MTTPHATQLILIPGIGDGKPIYHLFAWVLRLCGYRVHIFVFGWNSEGSFDDKQHAFNDYLRQFQNVAIVGVSAGGVAAVNGLYKYPDRVRKVVTICSPYYPIPNVQNQILRAALSKVRANLAVESSELTSRILSVHAVQDSTVPVKTSQVAGIASRQLVSIGHAVTIFLALTIYVSISKNFIH